MYRARATWDGVFLGDVVEFTSTLDGIVHRVVVIGRDFDEPSEGAVTRLSQVSVLVGADGARFPQWREPVPGDEVDRTVGLAAAFQVARVFPSQRDSLISDWSFAQCTGEETWGSDDYWFALQRLGSYLTKSLDASFPQDATAFLVNVPWALLDEKLTKVELRDTATGELIDLTGQPIRREYSSDDLNGRFWAGKPATGEYRILTEDGRVFRRYRLDGDTIVAAYTATAVIVGEHEMRAFSRGVIAAAGHDYDYDDDAVLKSAAEDAAVYLAGAHGLGV